MNSKSILKAAAVIVIILSIVHLVNMWALSVSREYLEDGEFYHAEKTADLFIPFDPLMYFPENKYEQHLTDIHAAESIRQYRIFHPVKENARVDVEWMKNQVYKDGLEFNFQNAWSVYSRLISSLENDDRSRSKALYNAFYEEVRFKPPEYDREVKERILLYSPDFVKLVDNEWKRVISVKRLLKKYHDTDNEFYMKKSIILMEGFAGRFERRYEKDMPLYWIYSMLIRKTDIFAAGLINSNLGTGSHREVYKRFMNDVFPLFQTITMNRVDSREGGSL